MSAGDLTQPTIVRIASNERADTVDINALAKSTRDQVDSLVRALVLTPRNATGTPVGTIFTGFTLTKNPSPSDGIVRIGSALGLAVDSDGKYIIKPAGTTVDIQIPSGGIPYQIYVYYTEVPGAVDYRRFITVSSPHSEYSDTPSTTSVASFGVHVRSGNLAAAVSEDSVSGRTRSLVLIGIATNTAGTITITGHDNVFAPNGTEITNRLTAVTQPATPFPTTPYRNNPWRSLDDKVNAALYMLGLLKWQGSQRVTPAAANNFGAYTTLTGSVDVAMRGRSVEITIGDDSSALLQGDINVSDYASVDLAIAAAIALFPSQGGTIVYRVQDTKTFAGNVTLPINKHIHIRGALDRGDDALAPVLDMSTFRFVCASGNTAPKTLTFENLRLKSTAAAATGSFIELHDFWDLILTDCQLSYASSYSSSSPTSLIFWNAATVVAGNVNIERSILRYANASNVQAGILTSTVATHTGDITADDSVFGIEGNPSTTPLHCGIRVANLQNNFLVNRCSFYANGISTVVAAGHTGIVLASTQNTSHSRVLRTISNCSFYGLPSGTNRAFTGISLGAISNVRIVDCDFSACISGIAITTTAQITAYTRITGCTFDDCLSHPLTVTISNGAYDGLTVTSCRWLSMTAGTNAVHVVGSAAGHNLRQFVFDGNHLTDGQLSVASAMAGATITRNRFVRSAFTAYQAISLGKSASVVVTDVNISDNHFTGCQANAALATTLGGLCVNVYAGTLQNLIVARSQCTDISNISYTPVSVFDQSVFRILGDIVNGVAVSHNQFFNVGTSLLATNGAAGRSVQAITIGSTTLNSDYINGIPSGNAEGVSITGNICGDLFSRIAPIFVEGFTTVRGLTISDNNFSYNLYTQAPHIAGGIVVRSYDAVFNGVYRNVTINNNTFRYSANPSAATTYPVLACGATFYNVRITGNQWSCTSASGHTAGGAMLFEGTWRYFQFFGNSGFNESDTSLTNAKFSFTANTATITSDPALPAVSSYWTSNFNIQRNA